MRAVHIRFVALARSPPLHRALPMKRFSVLCTCATCTAAAAVTRPQTTRRLPSRTLLSPPTCTYMHVFPDLLQNHINRCCPRPPPLSLRRTRCARFFPGCLPPCRSRPTPHPRLRPCLHSPNRTRTAWPDAAGGPAEGAAQETRGPAASSAGRGAGGMVSDLGVGVDRGFPPPDRAGVLDHGGRRSPEGAALLPRLLAGGESQVRSAVSLAFVDRVRAAKALPCCWLLKKISTSTE